MMMKTLFLLALAVSLLAQQTQFDVQSRLVLVPATVTDSKGRTVDGPELKDFEVLDDGWPRKVSVDSFGTGVAPIALVIAVQSSGISAAVLAKVRKIGSMIQPLVTGERGCAALLAFDERVQWRQECTKDPDVLSRAFEGLRPGAQKKARMLDASHEGIEYLRRRSNVRRVLLLISESRDRGSEMGLEAIAVDAQTAGVTVYAATYSAMKTGFTAKPADYLAPPPPTSSLPATGELERPPSTIRPAVPPPEQRVDLLGAIGELARFGAAKSTEVLTASTGGTVFPFTRLKGLEGAVEKLGRELHTQYILSFTPDSPTPGYHHLEVRVAGRPDLRVRARPGYWAAGGVR